MSHYILSGMIASPEVAYLEEERGHQPYHDRPDDWAQLCLRKEGQPTLLAEQRREPAGGGRVSLPSLAVLNMTNL